jgi:[acyl-carrier-protein] S-malonyltransferase
VERLLPFLFVARGVFVSRLAAVFANEGAQFIGMGKEFYDKSLGARKFFDETERILGLKVAKLCFLGPKEDQDRIENAHYAVLLNDLAAWELWLTNRRRAEVVMGVGVGEVAALVAAECMTFEAALRFVYKRAQWISGKVGEDRGRALTLIGLSEEQLRPSLIREEGEIFLTHRLAPDCFVVWGSAHAVESLELETKGAPGLKVLPATARGPLHTPLAAEWEGTMDALLTECMGGVGMKQPKVAVHRVSDGEHLESPQTLRDAILRQYSKPVDWIATVQGLVGRGLRSFVELGPGKVYTTLVKRIDSNTRIANVEDIKSLALALKVTS